MEILINTQTRTKDLTISMVISKAGKISSTLSKEEMIIPIAIRIRSKTKIKERISALVNQSINLPLTTVKRILSLKQKS